MNSGYSKFIRLINLLGDLILLNIAFIIAFSIKLWEEFDGGLPQPYLFLLLYFNFLWLFISFVFDNYELERFTRYRDIVRIILQSILFHLCSVALVFVFFQTTYFSRIHLVLTYGFFLAGILLWRISMIFLLRNYRKRGFGYKKFVIVGYGELGISLLNFFKLHPEFGCHFYGFFDNEVKGKDINGKLGELKDFVLENEVDEVYCSLPELDKGFLKELMQFADNHLIRIKMIPDFGGFSNKPLKIQNYGTIPVILSRKEPLEDILNRVLKRGFDLIFSIGVTVLILSWLIPLIALLVRLSSPGPIFFLQERSGKDGKKFWCFKFRTMKVNMESNNKQATRNDSRITFIGKILRKTNLDELPQFFNVLKGDMSVVGPRPHMLNHTEEYSEIVNKYMVRHFVKPGITGLAQVKGFRGETKNLRAMVHRIRMDIFYVENWSFILDLKIIWLTVYNMIKGDKNAF